MLNQREKAQLINETISRSRMIEDTTFYGLYETGGSSTTITADENKVYQSIKRGERIYVKARNGQLIL